MSSDGLSERRASLSSCGLTFVSGVDVFAYFHLCQIRSFCCRSYTVEDGQITVRAMTDLDAGAELLVSYLSFDVAMCPTTARRAELLSTK